jgi:hypothetical protein
MLKSIEKFVNSKDNGLMLLDLPTGFGKTTSVIKFIEKFINSNSSVVKRVYFVTNLKSNLPEKQLKELFGDHYNTCCLYLKPYWQSVTEKWRSTEIRNAEIINSDEYKNLKLDIETLYKFKADKDKLKEAKNFNNEYKQLKKLIKSYEQKIEKDTEVKFRQFIKKNYFYNKSTNDKNKFLNNNKWIEELYPACKLKDENIKVVLSSTKKFFSPMDTFSRMPFYIYNNNAMMSNTVTFIDEFDTTKETLLTQIIDDGLKFDIDIFSLFLNIYYSLTNLKFPNALMKLSDYRKEKIASDEWVDIKTLKDDLEERFKKVYDNYNFEFFTKSKGFEEKKAFIFDDGKSLNIFNDNSKRVLNTKLDKDENNISLYAVSSCIKGQEDKKFDNVLRSVKYAINDFVNKTAYISKNYTDYKNQPLKGYQTKYSFEESVLTILSAFNIANEFKQYLLDQIVDKDANLKLDLPPDSEFEFMRKGFEYTEIEDDHNHDLQTKSHAFKFDTTPEDIITKLSIKSRVVGISATASIDTVIGNYDIDYLKKILRDDFYYVPLVDHDRLEKEFLESQKIYDDYKIEINTLSVDNSNFFSDKEKSIEIINELFNEEKRKFYLDYLEKDVSYYHFFIVCKLMKLFKEVAESKNIFSFLAFLNSFPTTKDKAKNEHYLDKDILEKALNDLAEQNEYIEPPILHIVKSSNYDEEFVKINEELSEGKKVFVLSTYKTIGNGKNIQYELPNIESIKSNVISFSDNKPQKDFDAIYLSTPTNLIQMLSYDSENKVNELCKYLFQQEYLYQKKYIYHSERKTNIEAGFRKTFYGDKTFSSYKRNQDILLHTAQLVIQAVGRICRCRNKNKIINIFYDQEVINRLSIIKDELLNEKLIFNKEFKQLLDQPVKKEDLEFVKYTNKNKKAFVTIKKMSKAVRVSEQAVIDWQDLRDFVLRNPTANFIPDKYKELYFEFDIPYSGYAYKLNNNHEFTKITFNNSYETQQVSAEECELIRLMNIPELRKYFEENGYAIEFKSGRYIMTESLYNQVYKGAIGEVIGKYIIDKALGYDLEELDHNGQYEAFDFKIKNYYFDFKHWNYFIKDNDSYCRFIEWKLGTVHGAKVVVANILQRGNHKIKVSVDDKIIQVPYLINEDNEIDYTHLDDLIELI